MMSLYRTQHGTNIDWFPCSTHTNVPCP